MGMKKHEPLGDENDNAKVKTQVMRFRNNPYDNMNKPGNSTRAPQVPSKVAPSNKAGNKLKEKDQIVRGVKEHFGADMLHH
jgi:hypothetical protein